MRVRTGCLTAAGAVVLVLGLFAALNRDAASLFIGALLYSDPGPPAVAEGLTANLSFPQDGDRLAQRVGERLRNKFPAGTNDGELRSYLRQQGFKPVVDIYPEDERPNVDPNAMIYWWGEAGPVCASHLWINWQLGSNRRIKKIEVSYDYGCM